MTSISTRTPGAASAATAGRYELVCWLVFGAKIFRVAGHEAREIHLLSWWGRDKIDVHHHNVG